MGENEKKGDRRPALLTVPDAAAEIGVPYTSLRKLIVNGHLPFVRLGGGRRFWVKRSDLEKLVASSTETALAK